MNKNEIVEIAIDTVRRYDAKQKKSRHDRRLYNTRQLMKNYRMLSAHCKKSMSKLEDQPEENPIDILDNLDNTNKELYIESIRRSNLRTHIIMRHVDTMLNLLDVYCQQNLCERQYRVLVEHYIENKSIKEIAEKENVDSRTIYRDLNVTIERLGALIFGVDGLAVMS